MKLIIGVSATLSGTWGQLLPSSQNTMGRQKHPEVELYYLLPLGTMGKVLDLNYFSGEPDDYNYQHTKLKNFINDIWNKEWDFLLIGSQSSYFNFELCYKKMLTLPKKKCYCGIDGGGFASGSGFFISRDVADILRKNITPEPIRDSDCHYGSILLKKGIKVTPGAERVQYNFVTHKIEECYHTRCKTDTEAEKLRESEAFNYIFNKLCYLNK